jgi:multidrug efflux pump subunit AcrA (membrane-fusion protein)
MRFRGEVSRIVPTVDRAKATVLVKIRFVERDDRVLPEMSAKATFLERTLREDERGARTAVPASALVKGDGGTTVFVVEGEHVRRVPVATGAALGEMIEITSGVKPGEKIVLQPPATLADGAAARVATK